MTKVVFDAGRLWIGGSCDLITYTHHVAGVGATTLENDLVRCCVAGVLAALVARTHVTSLVAR